MENTTIIRRIDDLGRFVLPIDVRKKLNIMPGDTLEMTVYNDGIQIKKSTSLQNLIWLAKIIIKSLFEIYNNIPKIIIKIDFIFIYYPFKYASINISISPSITLLTLLVSTLVR